MARKKKTWVPKQGLWSEESMKKALHDVRYNGVSKKRASRMYGVPRTTLVRRLTTLDHTSPATRPPALSRNEEDELVSHILTMEERGFGLSITEICKLAYELAEKNNLAHPFNKEKKAAGYDWFEGFSQRHPCISVRKPESLSAARSTMLNENVVSTYFDKLGECLGYFGLKNRPSQIFNMDESGFSTVHKPGKIVGRRGKKGVHSKTSGERGENISVVCCVSAQGQALPPMIIFKGERISQGLIGNAPPGTLFACSKKSFIDKDLFYMWFEKIFLTHLPATRPVILIMDSHKSHMSLKVIELAKRNDVEMFCLPPHTTHWLQPLDRTIFGPMKKAYDKACDVFMKQNPGRQITRYDFCSIFNDVFSGKMNIPNIAGGFKATGIYPFNPRAICDAAYGPSRSSVIREPENPLPTTNEEVHVQPCESGAADQAQHANTASVSTPNTEILKIPLVVKEANTNAKKSKQITTARCITAEEFVRELKEKEAEKQKLEEEKAKRKQQREERRQEKQSHKLKLEMLRKATMEIREIKKQKNLAKKQSREKLNRKQTMI